MSKIFISYRRDDSQWQTKRLYDALCDQVPKPKQNIFYDLDSMRVGRDFRAKIDAAVSQCDLMIAVIGKNWLSQVDNETGNRRIDDPNDFVRIEISTALRREIPVVPVLVDETTMPKAEKLPEDLKSLSYRHGVKLRLDSFHSDMDALLNGLNLTELVGRKPFWSGKRLAGGGAAIVSALALALLVWSKIPFLPLSEGATGSFEGAGSSTLKNLCHRIPCDKIEQLNRHLAQHHYLFDAGIPVSSIPKRVRLRRLFCRTRRRAKHSGLNLLRQFR
ncbi:MAG: toll/interleukin-1 receptor domain-containing protein, partial [Pseudomonadota bacterium]